MNRKRIHTAVASVVASLLTATLYGSPSAIALAPQTDNGNTIVASNDGGGTTINSLCQAGWTYRSTGRGNDVHFKIGPTQANYNGTSTVMQSTFWAQATATVSASFSGGASVSIPIKVAEIKAKYGIAASVSITATLGTSITISVPSKKTGNADYGVFRAYTTGVEEYVTNACAVTQSKSVTGYTPYKVGFLTWVS